jgi:hypothetical protein
MENMKAVQVHSYGGPEVLRFEDAPRPTPWLCGRIEELRSPLDRSSLRESCCLAGGLLSSEHAPTASCLAWAAEPVCTWRKSAP